MSDYQRTIVKAEDVSDGILKDTVNTWKTLAVGAPLKLYAAFQGAYDEYRLIGVFYSLEAACAAFNLKVGDMERVDNEPTPMYNYQTIKGRADVDYDMVEIVECPLNAPIRKPTPRK